MKVSYIRVHISRFNTWNPDMEGKNLLRVMHSELSMPYIDSIKHHSELMVGTFEYFSKEHTEFILKNLNAIYSID
jgi:hypothetical protein